jgi:hypothetical protein
VRSGLKHLGDVERIAAGELVQLVSVQIGPGGHHPDGLDRQRRKEASTGSRSSSIIFRIFSQLDRIRTAGPIRFATGRLRITTLPAL